MRRRLRDARLPKPARDFRPELEVLEVRQMPALLQGGLNAPAAALLFEPNPSGTGYSARTSDIDVSVSASGMTFDLGKPPAAGSLANPDDLISLSFLAGNPNAPGEGLDPVSEASQGSLAYGEVEYKHVWTGIDASFNGASGEFAYDLTVEPGANPSQIAIGVTGAESLAITPGGNLAIEAGDGKTLVEDAPSIYQVVDDAQVAIAGNYVLLGGGKVGFEIGAYDPALPLVIDPDSAPTGVSATPAPNASMSIAYTLPFDAFTANIYRSTSPSSGFTKIASNVGPTSYMDSTLLPATTYYYYVTGNFMDGEGPASSTVSGTTYSLAQFAQTTYSVYESGGSATIDLELSAASSDTGTVSWSVSGLQISGPTSGTATFGAGDTSAEFDVGIVNDHGTDGLYPQPVSLALTGSTNVDLGTQTTANLEINDIAWEPTTTQSWNLGTQDYSASLYAISNQTNSEQDSVSLDPTFSVTTTYTVGGTVSYSYSAGDPTYAAMGLPPGVSIDATTGVISGSIGPDASEDAQALSGYFTPSIFADYQGNVYEKSFKWYISGAIPDPMVDPPNQTDAVGDTVSLQVTASQYDDDALSFSATGLPSGLSIDPGSGLISGVIDPSAASSVPYTVVVTGTDDTPSTPQSGEDTFYWTVNEGTPSPSLTSIGNQTNAAGDVVDVQLTATDSGTYSITYLASGLPAGLTIDPESGEITGTISNSAVSSTAHTVVITASDGQAYTRQTFTWAVGGVSLDVPDDQANLDGDSVLLGLTATDTGSGTLAYSASGLPAGLAINSATGVIDGTISATADTGSPDTVTVTASDGNFSESENFNWIISRVTLNVPSDQDNFDGASVSLAVTASDNVHSPSFSATGLPSGLSMNSSTGLISGTIGHTDHVQSPFEVTLTAADGTYSDVESFVWTVMPQIRLVSPGGQNNAFGDAVTVSVSAADHAGGTITYSATGLPTGLSINSSTGKITGTVSGSAAATNNATVSASDGTYTSAQVFSWNISTISLPPIAYQDNLDDDSVSLSAAADYNGIGTLTYGESGLPSGLSINSTTGLISGTIGNTADSGGPNTDGVYSVDVNVTDGFMYSTSEAFTWEVDPRFTFDDGDSDQTNVPGDSVSVAISAEDAATTSPTVTYSASGLPGGLSIGSTTGVISGTITATVSATPDSVTVTASDGAGSASESFNWTLSPVELPQPNNQASADESSVSLALSADVASGYTVSYNASGLPGGLSINSSTGVISGTLSSGDNGDNYVVSVSATAGTVTSTEEFAWSVGALVVAQPLDQTNTEGDSVSLAVSASALSGTLTYSAVGLPPGLSINSSTGVITGTMGAGAAENGPYGVEVVASNGTLADSQSFMWNVKPLVNVTSVSDQSSVEGDSVSLQVTGTETGATMTYSATGLPAGLSINSATGLISGTISSGDAAAGPYTVDVNVSNGTYYNDVYYTLSVTDGSTVAPTVSSPGAQVNVVGDSVNLAISASDTDSGSLSYAASGLPDGLSIDPDSGEITGDVAEDAVSLAPYLVTVSVTDASSGLTSTQTFSWLVNDSKMVLSPQSFSPDEDTDATFTLATFTDTDPNWTADEFTVSANFGDGTTDDNISGNAVITGGNGQFTITDDHDYATVGTVTATFVLSDGFQTVTESEAVVVAPPPIVATGGFGQGGVNPNVMSGGWNVSGEFAYFTDADGEGAANFGAVIYWGDGLNTTGTVTSVGDGYVVSADYNYMTPGEHDVTVVVSNMTDGTSATVFSTAMPGAVNAGLQTMTVGNFTDSSGGSASLYSGSISWGDGTTSAATIVSTGTGYAVVGTHTFTDSEDESGNAYTVSASVSGPQGEVADTSLTTMEQVVYVTRPGVGLSTTNIAFQPGIGFSNVAVATFTDPNIDDGSGEFSAIVDWGDGTTSGGTVVKVAPGLFQVLGGHTYASTGTFVAKVLLSQEWDGDEYSQVAALDASSSGAAQEELLPAPEVYWATLRNVLKQSTQVKVFGGGILNEMMAKVPTVKKGMETDPAYQNAYFIAGNVNEGNGFIAGAQYSGAPGSPMQKYVIQFAQVQYQVDNEKYTEFAVEAFPVFSRGYTYIDPIGYWYPADQPFNATVTITFAYGTSYDGVKPDLNTPLTQIIRGKSSPNEPNPKLLTLDQFKEKFTPTSGRTSKFASYSYTFESSGVTGRFKLTCAGIGTLLEGKDQVKVGTSVSNSP